MYDNKNSFLSCILFLLGKTKDFLRYGQKGTRAQSQWWPGTSNFTMFYGCSKIIRTQLHTCQFFKQFQFFLRVSCPPFSGLSSDAAPLNVQHSPIICSQSFTPQYVLYVHIIYYMCRQYVVLHSRQVGESISTPVTSFSGVGSNQNIGGQTVSRESATDNFVIFYLGPPKSRWANSNPTHPAPTLLLDKNSSLFHMGSKRDTYFYILKSKSHYLLHQIEMVFCYQNCSELL